jgi:hypothetical protein
MKKVKIQTNSRVAYDFYHDYLRTFSGNPNYMQEKTRTSFKILALHINIGG